eukprot:g17954.t1
MEWEALRAGAQDARSEVTFAQPGLPRDVRLAFDEHRASRAAPQAAGPAAPDNFFVGTTNNMPDAMRFAEQGVAVNLRGSSTSYEEERKNHYHRTKPTPGFDLSQNPDLAKGLGRVYSKNVYCYATENYGPSRAAPPPQVLPEAASSSALVDPERTPSPKQKKRKEKPESEDYVFELPTVGTVNGLSKFARIVLDRIRARTEREVITPFFSQVQPIVMVPARRGVVGEEGVDGRGTGVGGGDATTKPAVVARRLGTRKQLYRKDVGLMESDEQRVRAFGLLCAGTTGSQNDLQASSGAAAKISPPPASGCDYYMKPLQEYQQILDLHKAARENQQSAKSKSTSEDYRSASSRSVSKEEVSAGVAAPVVQPQAQFLPLPSLSSRSVISYSANASRAASTSASAAPSAAASAPQSKGPSPTATRSPTAFQLGARPNYAFQQVRGFARWQRLDRQRIERKWRCEEAHAVWKQPQPHYGMLNKLRLTRFGWQL